MAISRIHTEHGKEHFPYHPSARQAWWSIYVGLTLLTFIIVAGLGFWTENSSRVYADMLINGIISCLY